jgi:NADH:ubiquinone oxidoreductase subunit H
MGKFNLDILDCLYIVFSFYIKPLLVVSGLMPYVHVLNSIATTLVLKFCTTLYFLSTILSTIFKSTSLLSIIFAVKYIILIALLVFVRGGIPRYRYDFLTKLGWIKTLTLILVFFLTLLLFTYIF